MTRLARIAMLVSLMMCTGHAASRDWKAQPAPKVTGKVDMRQLPDTGCRVLAGFSGQTDGSKWGVLATYEVATPPFSRVPT